MTLHSNSTLHLAFSAALTARHPAIQQHLLSSTGSFPFTPVLVSRPSRQSIDVLSILAPSERTVIYHYLHREARARLPQPGMTFLDQLTFTRKKSTLLAASDWLQRKSSIADKVVGPGMQHSSSSSSPSSRMPMSWATHPRTLNNSKDKGVSA